MIDRRGLPPTRRPRGALARAPLGPRGVARAPDGRDGDGARARPRRADRGQRRPQHDRSLTATTGITARGRRSGSRRPGPQDRRGHRASRPRSERLAALFQDGGLVVAQGVGMPNPDRSHFTSLDRWHTGRIDGSPARGRVDRTRHSDGVARGPDAGLAGVALGERVDAADPPAPRSARRSAARHSRSSCRQDAVRDASSVGGTRAPGCDGGIRRGPQARRGGARPAPAPRRACSRRSVDGRCLPVDAAGRPARRRAQARRSRDLAHPRDLRAPGRLRHSRPPGRRPAAAPRGPRRRARGVRGGDPTKRSLGRRVLVIVYSEFGRRVAENGSRGTDHGSGAPVLLVGRRPSGRTHRRAARPRDTSTTVTSAPPSTSGACSRRG